MSFKTNRIDMILTFISLEEASRAEIVRNQKTIIIHTFWSLCLGFTETHEKTRSYRLIFGIRVCQIGGLSENQ